MNELTLLLQARRNNRPTIWEMKGVEIEPCPFCGCADINLAKDDWMHWCCCADCGVEGPVRDNRINAIARWQCRANQ